MFVIVKLPSFVTVILYLIVSPSAYVLPFAGVEVVSFSTFRLGPAFSVLTVAVAFFSRSSTFAVTVLVKLPLRISASVIVYVAVVVTFSPAGTFSNALFASVTPSISVRVIVLGSA